ncbi:MAG TPA: hypothetical protein V6D08_19760 [Candidatus Obscuribacterales bacterium]
MSLSLGAVIYDVLWTSAIRAPGRTRLGEHRQAACVDTGIGKWGPAMRHGKIAAGILSSVLFLSCAGGTGVLGQDSYRIRRDDPEPASLYERRMDSPQDEGVGRLIFNTVVDALARKFPSPPHPQNYLPRESAGPGASLPKAEAYPPSAPQVLGALNLRDLEVIGRRDVVILVDKSGSMTTQDCPSGLASRFASFLTGTGRYRGASFVSRWQWCQEQVYSLRQQVARALPGGLTLAFFDSKTRVFNNVDAEEIPSLFASNRPGGGTNMARALREQLADYFARRAAAGNSVKPLAVAIITDGLPDSASSLRAVIADATRKLHYPGEIAITFLQIGNETQGSSLLYELDNQLVAGGARYDIVDSKLFSELTRFGLARPLVDAITESERG